MSVMESSNSYQSLDIKTIDAMYKSLGFGVGIYTPDGTMIYLNNIALENMQQTEGELYGKTIIEVFGEEKGTVYFQRIQNVVSTGISYNYKDTVILPTGTKWFCSTYAPIWNAEGSIVAIQILSDDITAQKKVEEDLHQSKEKFSLIFENKGTAAGVFGEDKIITLCNQKFEELSGYTKDEIINKKKWSDFVATEDLDRMLQYHQMRSKDNNAPNEYEANILTKEGERKSVLIHIDILPNSKERIVTLTDITAIKNIEKEISKTKDFYHSILEGTVTGVLVTDKNDIITYANKGMGTIAGIKPSQIQNVHVLSGFPESTLEDFTPYYNKAKTTLTKIYYENIHVTTHSGRDSWQSGWLIPRINDGKYVGMICTVEDITDKLEKEKQLKDSQERYNLAMDATKDGLYDWNLVTNEIYYSPGWKKMLGYKYDELPNDFSVWETHTDPEDVKKSWKLQNELINKKRDRFEMKFKMKHKNGHWIDILSRATAIFNEEGKAIRIVGTHVNITELEQFEKLLHDNEQKYRNLVESIADVVFDVSVDGIVKYISPNIKEIIEYQPEELIGAHFKDVIYSKDMEKASEGFEYHKNGGKNQVELRMVKKNGETVWVSLLGKLTGHTDTLSFRGVLRDITKMKEIKKETEEILNTAADGIRIINTDFTVKTMNDTFANMINIPKEQAIGMKCFEQFRSQDCGTDQCSMVQILKHEERIQKEDKRTTKDDKEIPCFYSSKPYRNESGEIIGIIEDFRDITPIKNKEKALRQSEEKFHSIVDNIGIGVALISPQMEILELNNQMKTWFPTVDINPKPICYQTFNNPPLETICTWCPTQKTLQDGKVHSNITNTPHEDTIRHYRIISSPIFDENGSIKAAIEMVDDITEQIQSEQDLKKAHKELKTLNQDLEKQVDNRTKQIQTLLTHKDEFINQLGHDLKNPMGPLLNLLPILERKEEDAEKKNMLHVINRNVKYMKNLISKTIQLAQLRSPNTEFHFEKTNLQEIIDDILTSNQLLFKENEITIHSNIPQSLYATIDRLQIHEVFTNLLNNSCKYTDGPGEITINAEKQDEHTIQFIIKDTGIGMTSDQINKIFTEFYKVDSARHDFTSSGLGLSIVKRIIKKHNGKIWVESEGLGKGSTFFFTLPLHKKSES